MDHAPTSSACHRSGVESGVIRPPRPGSLLFKGSFGVDVHNSECHHAEHEREPHFVSQRARIRRHLGINMGKRVVSGIRPVRHGRINIRAWQKCDFEQNQQCSRGKDEDSGVHFSLHYAAKTCTDAFVMP